MNEVDARQYTYSQCPRIEHKSTFVLQAGLLLATVCIVVQKYDSTKVHGIHSF